MAQMVIYNYAKSTVDGLTNNTFNQQTKNWHKMAPLIKDFKSQLIIEITYDQTKFACLT